MSTASSASDRIDQARAALEGHAKARLQHDRFNERYGFLAGSADALAEALRGMVSPASVDEAPEQVADEWYTRLQVRGLVETYGFDKVTEPAPLVLHREAYLAGIRRGIVMGWNSWEPETAPGLPSGTVEQLIADGKAALDKVEHSTESDRMDDTFDARDEAARWIAQVIELLEEQS